MKMDTIIDEKYPGLTARKNEWYEIPELDIKCNVEIRVNLRVLGSMTVGGNHYSTKSISVGGDQRVDGGQHVVGDQHIEGNQRVEGNQHVGKYQHVGRDQYVGGKQRVVGYQHVVGYQYVGGRETGTKEQEIPKD
jgi:hypothetical protein